MVMLGFFGYVTLEFVAKHGMYASGYFANEEI